MARPSLISGRRQAKQPGPRPNTSTRVPAPVPARWRATLCRFARAVGGVTVLILVVYGTVIGYQKAAPLVARWFEVRDITIIGADQVTRSEVIVRLALRPGQTLFSVNPRRLALRVQSHPWVKHADVRAAPPHGLSVRIVERRAAAVLRGPSMVILVDDEGQVLSVLPPANDPDLPLLIGVNPKGVIEKERRFVHAVQRGVELAGLLGRTFQGRPQVDVGNPDNVVAYVEGLKLQFGSSSFEEKWDRYQKLEPHLSEQAGPTRREAHNEIDLRYPGKVIVRERG